MPPGVQYQCSRCAFPLSGGVSVASCPHCGAKFNSVGSVGLGAATFTWMEALGFLAVGIVLGVVGGKYLGKI